MRQRIAIGATICHLVFMTAGCARLPEPSFTPGEQTKKLKPEFQQQIAKILNEQCGRPLAPKMLGDAQMSAEHLKRGAEVFSRYCVQCHGVNGDGKGVAATYLIPKPRNYLAGIFKFTSTTYGSKPLREDLLRTIRRGVRGTSMPAFPLLAPRDLESVVDYVMALTHRGELESKLADEAEFDDKIDESTLPATITEVLARWDAARGQVVYPITPMPTFKRSQRRSGKAGLPHQGMRQVPRRGWPRHAGDEHGRRRLGFSDQGSRPDLRHAPRRHRASGHLPSRLCRNQRHSDAVVQGRTQG